jgi:hypothetical protein
MATLSCTNCGPLCTAGCGSACLVGCFALGVYPIAVGSVIGAAAGVATGMTTYTA